jgi:hypothetical protein
MWYIDSENKDELSRSLRALDQTTLNFSWRMIKDHQVRTHYLKHSKETAHEIYKAVKKHRISPQQGAKEANRIRNDIMAMMRIRSSEIGRAAAEKIKPNPRTLNELEIKYARKEFNQEFSALNKPQKDYVWRKIVEASGQPDKTMTIKARVSGFLGRGLVIATAAIVTYNIYTAEDRKEAAKEETVNLIGGALGAAAGSGVAGLACGPGAPVCVTLLIFIGGVVASYGLYHVRGMYYR